MSFSAALFAAFLADQASKFCIERTDPEGKLSHDFLNGRVRIRRLENRGSAGGLLSGRPGLVRLAATAAETGLILLSPYLAKGGASPAEMAGWGLVAGGGLGNVCDRWRKGAVTDFISILPGKRRPADGDERSHSPRRTKIYVFNIADMMIACGGILIVMISIFGGKS